MGCDRFRYWTLRFEPNAFWNILVVLVENGHTSAGVAVRISATAETTVIKGIAELMATMFTDSFVHAHVTLPIVSYPSISALEHVSSMEGVGLKLQSI